MSTQAIPADTADTQVCMVTLSAVARTLLGKRFNRPKCTEPIQLNIFDVQPWYPINCTDKSWNMRHVHMIMQQGELPCLARQLAL